MTRVAVAATGDLTGADLAAARALLLDAFAGELTDDDWAHCLGGHHALVHEGDRLVAHAALVPRVLHHSGSAWRTGYLEGVGVRPADRRRGHASAAVAALERHGRTAYELLALSTTDDGLPLYVSRGWQPWRGPTAVRTAAGDVPTPDDDGSVLVLAPDPALDLDGLLVCEWRAGDVW